MSGARSTPGRKAQRRREILILLFAAHVIGVVAGLATLLFDHLIPLTQGVLLDGNFSFEEIRMVPPPTPGSIVDLIRHVLAPAIGGLALGVAWRVIPAAARGHGVAEVIEAIALQGSRVSPVTGLVRILTAALTIGSGGSAGKEGPTVQIGAAAGSFIGDMFRLPTRRRRVLLACGASAGISAVFNAPLAGIVFALEILLGELFLAAYAPVMISASVAAVLRRYLIGSAPLFELTGPARDFLATTSPTSALAMAVLGVLGGLAGVLYVRGVVRTEIYFEGLNIAPLWKPALAGLAVGVIGAFLPEVLGEGYGTVDIALVGALSALAFVAIFITKIAVTALTLGSGGSGGAFAPALVIGAALGAAFGRWMHVVPGFEAAPAGAFAVVGTAAVLTGSLHAPVTAVVFALAMTQDYRIVLPVVVATVGSLATSWLLQRDSLYTWRLRERGIDVRAGREETVLRLLKAASAMKPAVKLSENASFHDVAELALATDAPVIALVDPSGALTGALVVEDFREFLRDKDVDSLFIARELAHVPAPVVPPTADLFHALQLLSREGMEGVLVVDELDPTRVEGLLTRRDVLDAYESALQRKADEADLNMLVN